MGKIGIGMKIEEKDEVGTAGDGHGIFPVAVGVATATPWQPTAASGSQSCREGVPWAQARGTPGWPRGAFFPIPTPRGSGK